MEQNNNVKREKWFESRLAFMVLMGGALVAMIIPVYQMKTDIAVIQQSINYIEANHLATIERKMISYDKTINEINLAIERIKVKLEID